MVRAVGGVEDAGEDAMFGGGLIGEGAVHENEGEQQQVEEDAELTP